MKEFNFGYANDLIIFGVDSRRDKSTRCLPSKYLSILLIKRESNPHKNMWALPGGFVNSNETSKEASIRILKKETGLNDVYMQQIGVNDDVLRDPRGRVVSTTYMALVDRTIIKQELSKNASWFDVYVTDNKNVYNVLLKNDSEIIEFKVKKEIIDLKSQEFEYSAIDRILSFDHDKILVKGLMELRNKVKNTDIVFNLMPELFTIGELKQVYEILLGKSLINSAFRRTISDKIIVTDKSTSTGGHRPSQLCRYNEKNSQIFL